MAKQAVRIFRAVFSAAMGLALGVIAVYAMVVAGQFVWQALLSIEKEIAATIIATSGTILVAVATLVYSQRRSKQRDIAEAHREKKVAIYQEFMRVIVDVQRNAKLREQDPSLPELPVSIEEFFYAFTRDSIVWASPEMIQSWYRFKNGSTKGGVNVLLLVDDILREIRKDLGNSNRGLRRGHLIRLFVRDAAEHGLD